ncbi:MAG: class aldolase/adducin family protein [Rhodococcus erythropolis]|jgi:ribulose-5-phosphate 4-epimerase/fuculose-1-phosphate aldolase|uniref:class II aldolase/adducin family protein n=1 Tax=Rhodococcus qingshengii TaxID=334542 RepID=UPI00242D386C|nr:MULTISPECIES: class II aldolase/adducin family protein [Rhodococcus erythropolis group]MDF2898801.1 class aldolase/adducin family protein [Rhodococcus erythropolis]MDT9664718.1 class II aldolase/adducin family protein [Rhodococcus qingshengii]
MTITATDPRPRERAEKAVGFADRELPFPLPPTFDSVDAEREYRKEQLADGFKIFSRLGFSEGVTGHITVRDPGEPDTFWVNPFGMAFSRITAADLVRCDHDGNVLEGRFHVNRPAFVIHAEVHRARPDAVASAHAHSLHGKAFSTLGIPLDPLTPDACAFFEDHGLYAEFGGVAKDVEEGKRIAESLGDHKAAILQNHGLITVGKSVAEAVWWFVSMDRACQAQLLAMAAGTPKPIDRESALKVRRQTGGHFSGWFRAQPMWAELTEPNSDSSDRLAAESGAA